MNAENQSRRSTRRQKPKRESASELAEVDLKSKKKFKKDHPALVETVTKTITEPQAPAVKLVKKQDLRNRDRKLGLLKINCEEIVGERSIDVGALTNHLQRSVKIDGKLNDPRVEIKQEGKNIHINADTFLEQDYVKFLIKKYLKKENLHNWVKIAKAKKTFVLEYFKM